MNNEYYLHIFTIILFSLTFLNPFNGFGQFDNTNEWSQEQKEVYNALIQLFDGMKNSDKASIISAFANPEKTSMKVININGKSAEVTYRAATSFIEAAGSEHEQTWDERAWNTTIRIDGNMAQLWTNYAFFLDDTFHHCGVNAIQYYKSKQGWKIIDLSYTHRTNDCDVPARVMENSKE